MSNDWYEPIMVGGLFVGYLLFCFLTRHWDDS